MSPRLARLPEPLEQARHVFGGDPDAGVRHPEQDVPSPGAAPTVIRPPGSVNLIALPTRFSKTWSRRSRSAHSSGSSRSACSRSSSDAEAASGAWAWMASAMTWPADTRSCSIERRPPSMRATSSRSWMRRFIRVAARSISSAGFRDRRSGSPRLRRSIAACIRMRAQRVAQIVGDDAEHVVAQLDRSLGDPVEARLLHRQGGARRHRLGERNIVRR